MKKTFSTTFFRRALFLVLLFGGVTNLWGDTEVATLSFSYTQYGHPVGQSAPQTCNDFDDRDKVIMDGDFTYSKGNDDIVMGDDGYAKINNELYACTRNAVNLPSGTLKFTIRTKKFVENGTVTPPTISIDGGEEVSYSGGSELSYTKDEIKDLEYTITIENAGNHDIKIKLSGASQKFGVYDLKITSAGGPTPTPTPTCTNTLTWEAEDESPRVDIEVAWTLTGMTGTPATDANARPSSASLNYVQLGDGQNDKEHWYYPFEVSEVSEEVTCSLTIRAKHEHNWSQEKSKFNLYTSEVLQGKSKIFTYDGVDYYEKYKDEGTTIDRDQWQDVVSSLGTLGAYKYILAIGKNYNPTYYDYFTITASANVFCTEAPATGYKVAYYDGDTKLGTETVIAGETPQQYEKYQKKINHDFVGWYNESDWSSPADFTAAINADKNFYGKWTPGLVDNMIVTGNNTTSQGYGNQTMTVESVTDANNFFNHNVLQFTYSGMNGSGDYRGINVNRDAGYNSSLSNGATGFGFYYKTAAGQTITFCFDYDNGSNQKKTELPSTNGFWKYAYVKGSAANGWNNPNVIIYVNGSGGAAAGEWTPSSLNVSSATTTPNSGTFYIAEICATQKTTKPEESAATYTVTFNVNGHSSAPAAQQVANGGKVTQPANPQAMGWGFDGWYKEAACTHAWDFSTDVVTKDTTLYAKWNVGWTFYCNSGGDVGHKLIDNGDGTLSWTQHIDANITDYFHFGDGSGYRYAVTGEHIMDKDHCTDWKVYQNQSTYVGLRTTAAGDYTFTVSEANAMATELYVSVTYPASVGVNINYQGHGGNNYTIYTNPNCTIANKDLPQTPSETNYKFLGWYANSECTTPFDFTAPITANTTAYAKWTLYATSTYSMHLQNTEGGDKSYFIHTEESSPYYYIFDFAIPATTYSENFFVGNNGKWYDSNLGYANSKSANWWYGWLPFTNLQGKGSNITLGSASGAIGTLRIVDNSGDDNLYISFDPQGYGLSYGTPNQDGWVDMAFTQENSGTIWNTTPVTLTSDMLGKSFYVGLAKQGGGYVFSSRSDNGMVGFSNTVAFTTMGVLTKTDEWRSSNLTSADAGQVGHFQIWTHNTAQNGCCHFVLHYNATFVYNNAQADTHTEYKSCLADNIITFPTPEAKTGYTFEGWYDNYSFTGTKYNAGDEFNLTNTGSKTFYAKWTPKTSHITFNANGGKIDGNDTKVLDYIYDGSTLTLPTPNWTGHHFEGWFTETTGGTQIDNVGGTNKPLEDVEYFAQWTINQHNLTWAGIGGATLTGEFTAAGLVDYGTTLVAPTVSKTGYEFTGWTPAVAATMPDNDVTYTAQWNIINYTITYHNVEASEHTNPATYTITSADITLSAPTARTGYEFGGWYLDSNFGTEITTIFTGSHENKDIYAKWTAKQHKVTINLDGGAIEDGTWTQESGSYYKMFDFGATISLPTPTKTGYSFNEWTPAVPETMPDEDVTLTATWAVDYCNNTFTIQCEENRIEPTGGTGKPGNLKIIDNTKDMYYINAHSNDGVHYYVDFKGSTGEIYYFVHLPAATYNFDVYLVNSGSTKVRLYSPNGTGSKTIQWNSTSYKQVNTEDNWEVSNGATGEHASFAKSTISNKTLEDGDYIISLRTDNDWAAFDQIVITADSKVFCPEMYTVTFTQPSQGSTSAQTIGGETITTGTKVPEGTQVIFTWEKATGYEFDNFSDGTNTYTQNPCTLPVNSDLNITTNVKVEVPKYDLTVSVNDNDMGTATGTGKYAEDEEVSLTATPNEHYRFVNWTVEEVEVSTDANYTYTMPNKATTIVANFEAIPQYTITVNVASQCAGQGTVSGSNTYYEGDKVTITATPNTGYAFDKWNDDDTNASREITVSQSQTYTAYFKVDYCSNTLTIDCHDSYLTSTQVTGGASSPSQLEALATTDDYKGWHGNGFVQFGNSTGTIYFYVHIPETTTYDIAVWNANGGDKYLKIYKKDNSGSLTYKQNKYSDTNKGFQVSNGNWESTFVENKQTGISLDADDYIFALDAGSSYGAYDQIVITADSKVFCPEMYTVTFTQPSQGSTSAQTIGGETITTGTKVPEGTQVIFTWNEESGYDFVKFNDGTTDYTQNPCTLTVNSNLTVTTTVEVEVTKHTLTASVAEDQASWGHVDPTSQQVGEGRDAQVTAIVDNNQYRFDYWSSTDVELTEQQAKANPLKFTMPTKDVAVVAHFVFDEVHNMIATGTRNDYNSGTDGYNQNASLTLSSIADPSGYFNHNVLNVAYTMNNITDNDNSYYGKELLKDEGYTTNSKATGYGFWYMTEKADDQVYFEFKSGENKYTFKLPATNGSWVYKYIESSDAKTQTSFEIYFNGKKDNFAMNYTSGNILFSEIQATNVTSQEPIVPKVNLTVEKNPVEGGTVTTSPATTTGLTKGTEVTLTATPTPETGYRFVNWTVNGVEVSTEATYNRIVNATETITANFERVYTLVVNHDANIASVTGEGQYAAGESVTVTATATQGYKFTNWTEGAGGEELATTSSYTFDMPATDDYTVYANSEVDITYYQITLGECTNGTIAATVNGLPYTGGDLTANTPVVLTATPAEGYGFVQWIDGSREITRTIYANAQTQAITWTATFAQQFTVTATYGKPGTEVTGQGEYATGAQVTLEAQWTLESKDFTYGFKEWTNVSGVNLSEKQKVSNPLTFIMPYSSVTMKATFAPVECVDTFVIQCEDANYYLPEHDPLLTKCPIAIPTSGSCGVYSNHYLGYHGTGGYWDFKQATNRMMYYKVHLPAASNYHFEVWNTVDDVAKESSIYVYVPTNSEGVLTYDGVNYEQALYKRVDYTDGKNPATFAIGGTTEKITITKPQDIFIGLYNNGESVAFDQVKIYATDNDQPDAVFCEEKSIETFTILSTEAKEIPVSGVKNLVVYEGGQATNEDDVEVFETVKYIRSITEQNIDMWYTFAVPYTATKTQVSKGGDVDDIHPVYRTEKGKEQVGYYFMEVLTNNNPEAIGIESRARWDMSYTSQPQKDSAYITMFPSSQSNGYFIGSEIFYIGNYKSDGGVTLTGSKNAVIENGGWPETGKPKYYYFPNSAITAIQPYDAYVLNEDHTMFVLTDHPTILPFQCYIQATTEFKEMYPRIAIRKKDDGGVTTELIPISVEEMNAAHVEKFIKDDIIYILRDNKIYTIMGQPVK